jgi:hypothetical protein
MTRRLWMLDTPRPPRSSTPGTEAALDKITRIMPELPLDDVDRHPFPRELDSMPMSELVGGEPTTNTGLGGELTQLAADRGRRPRPTAGRAVDNAEQRPDR